MSDELKFPSNSTEWSEFIAATGILTGAPDRVWRLTVGSTAIESVAVKPSRSVTSTTCARCSATIDPAAVEQHHERCFVVGDAVRWWPYNYADNPNAQYIEGRVAKTAPLTIEVVAVRNFGLYDSLGAIVPGGVVDPSCSPGTIRHIQRPEQAIVYTQPGHNGVAQLDEKQPTLSARLGHLKHGPGGSGLSGPCDADCRKCEIERNTTRAGRIQAITELAYDGKITGEQARELLTSPDLEPTAPTLYDGLTAADCYMRWCDNRALIEDGRRPLYHLTPSQIAAGRRAYQMDALNEHADELRARISAAKERERLTVCMPLDAEDLPW